MITGYAPFFYVYMTALAGIELLIGLAFAWRARTASSRKIALLATAYAWSLPIALLNVLLLPGVSPVATRDVVQAGPATWLLWHIGWALLLIAYAGTQERPWHRSIVAVFGTLAASLVCSAATVLFAGHLPHFVSSGETMLPVFIVPIGISLVLDAAALGMLVRGRTTNRDALVAAAVAFTLVEALCMLISGERFSPQFYIARIVGLLADVSMLCAVLADAVGTVRKATLESVDRNRLIEFELMAEAMPHIVWRIDETGRSLFMNRRWTEYTGRELQNGRDAATVDALHPDDRSLRNRAFESARDGHAPYEVTYRLRAADGTYRHFISRGTPLIEDGVVIGWIGTTTDIEDQRRLEQERAIAYEREARDAGRMRLVATVGRALSQSLDAKVVLDTAVRAVVPFIADYAIINMHQTGEGFVAAATHHRDPARARKLSQLVGNSFVRGVGAGGTADVAASATTIYVADIDDEFFAAAIKPEWVSLCRSFGARSCVIVPLVVNGVVRGTMSVTYADSGRRYQPEDIEVLDEIGRRVSLSLDNAEHYAREHRVADRLQEALLPASLPAVTGVTLSAVYQAGRSEAQIGGDWFDAFPSSDGRLFIGVGDVMGSGLDAAIAMSSVRQAIRGAAEVSHDPVTILNAVDRTLLSEQGERLVTAFIGLLDPITGALTYASAGHPPPFVRWSDGRVERLRASGLPLGLRSEARSDEQPNSITLEDECLLVLYTDGLTEAERDFEKGEGRLALALGDCTAKECTAERILADVLGDVPDTAAHDDVAILTLHLDASRKTATKRISCDVRDGDAVRRARHAIIEALRSREVSEDMLFNAELALGELLGNVAKHAPGSAEIILHTNGVGTRLSVLDRGPGIDRRPALPDNVLSEGGRGLFIVSNVTSSVDIKKRPGGGTEVSVLIDP